MSNSSPAGMTGARTAEPFASLPMYDFPHLQEINDFFWQAVSDRLATSGLGNIPTTLKRPDQLELSWRDPDMFISQTCGYPLVTSLRGAVQLVATPRYTAPGCFGAFHRSAIIVRRSDPATSLDSLRGRRCAVNEMSSNTGMNLLRAKIAPLARGDAFFQSVTVTGSHLQSMALVVGNLADIAAIDCVTFAHLKTHAPELVNEVRILDWTDATPCLPLITSIETDAATLTALRAALKAVIHDDRFRLIRDALFLDGFEFLSMRDYQAIVEYDRKAVALRYPKVA